MNKKTTLRLLMTLTGFFAWATMAANLIWDVTPGDGAAVTDGSGVWSNGGSNWNDGAGDLNWNNGTPDAAVIGSGGAPGTLTLGSAVTTASTTFNFGGYVIADGGNSSTWGALAGAGGFTYGGSGTLTINGAGGTSGTITLNSGTLDVGSNTAFGTSSFVLAGGRLYGNGGSTTSSITNGISAAPATTSTLEGGGGAGFFGVNGPLTGSGTLVTVGGVRFAGDNSGFSGTMDVNTTIYLNLGQSGSAAASWLVDGTVLANDPSGANVTYSIGSLAGSGILQSHTLQNTFSIGALNQNDAFDGIIRERATGIHVGHLTKVGTGTQTLTGASTYTGATTVANGTLRIGDGSGNGSISAASDVIVNPGAAFDYNFDPTTPVSLANNISGGGVFRKSQNNVVTLMNAANDFTGRYDVAAGMLAIDSFAAMGDPSRVHVGAGATFDLSTADTAGVINGSGSNSATNTTYSGTGTIETGGKVFDWNNGVTFAPGNSPGILNVGGGGTLSWGVATGGGTYNWELYDGALAPGTGWDLINVDGTLDLTGGSGTIVAIGLASISPDVAGVPNNVNMDPGFSPKETTFELIRTTAGVIGLDTFTPTFVNNLNHQGFFRLSTDGTSLFLTWIPTPEPGTWALLTCLLVGGYTVGKRRRKQPVAG